MGYLYKGVCYPDLPTAKAQQCANAGGLWGNTTSAYTAECTSVGTSSLNMCRRLNGGACTVYTQPFEAYQSCTFDGGATLATDWSAAALIILSVVWGIKKLNSLFSTNHNES